MMDLKAKLIVTFVWGIVIFETSCYLILYAPLLYIHVPKFPIRTFPSSSSSFQYSSQLFPYNASATTSLSTVSLATPATIL